MALDPSFPPIPNLLLAAPLPGAAAFSATPPLDLLRQAAARWPDAVALAGSSGNVSFAALLAGMAKVAAAVAAVVPPGRAMACLVPQTPQGLVGMLGCLVSGRICLMLNPTEPDDRLAALLADAAPAALLLSAPRVMPLGLPVLSLPALLDGPAVPFPERTAPWDPDAPLSVHFTSGSTGRPKGIVLSARTTLYRAGQGLAAWQAAPGDAALVTSPTCGANVLAIILGVLTGGGRFLAASIAEEGAGALLRLAQREAVTLAAAPPPLMRMLARLPAALTAFASLRLFRMGAATLAQVDVALARQVLPPGCAIEHTYASTEATVVARWILPQGGPGESGLGQAGLTRAGLGQAAASESVMPAGPLEPGHEAALLDTEGRPVAPGAAGELVLRGPVLALGEWRGGRVVPAAMLPEPGRPGWRRFHTGDLARVGADGLLRVLGRADRQVKVNGTRVEPAEVEAVLRAEAGVVDAAVLALTVAGGTVLHGFVAAPGADAAALQAALRGRLAAALPMALRPAWLTVLDRLPTLPSGKLDQQALRALAE